MREIYNLRVAQAPLKYYKETVRKLQQEDLRIRREQARSEGRRLQLEQSEHEREIMDSQRHDYFSDWGEDEQQKFRQEQDSLWSMIPEQFRERARRLARGGT